MLAREPGKNFSKERLARLVSFGTTFDAMCAAALRCLTTLFIILEFDHMPEVK